MSIKAPRLERALGHHRGIIIGALAIAIAVCWLYLLAGAGMSMHMPASWTLQYSLLVLVMWWVMMTAMMLPSAAPTILLFSALSRKMGERGHPAVPAGLFAAAYVAVWGAFSVVATLVQMLLQREALLDHMMASTSVPLGAALLLAAGVYQLTPLKHACLRHCRSPLQFFGHRWRKGAGGAFLMGLEHGGYCLGCCWVMMALLFYAGVMNLTWIIALALYVLLEKVAPAGQWIGRFAGAALIVWAVVLLAGY